MSAPGTPKASQAAITAVQESLDAHLTWAGACSCGWKTRLMPGWQQHANEHVAQAAADAAAPHNAGQTLRDFADTRGVNVGDEGDDWWTGYRQAQRECLQDAVKAADRIEGEP